MRDTLRALLTDRFGVNKYRAEDEGFSEVVIEEIVRCIGPLFEAQQQPLRPHWLALTEIETCILALEWALNRGVVADAYEVALHASAKLKAERDRRLAIASGRTP